MDDIEKFQVVFVLGGPGSGKGTQCSRIKEQFAYEHLSAGDLLRAEKETGSEVAEMINTYIKEGKIVPAEVTVGLLKTAMQKSKSRKFLIDGFPRSKDNLDTWYKVMADDFSLQMVLVFDCPEEVLQERLLDRGKTSGRSDDNLASIRKRFKTFHQQSEPVIAEFRRMGKVRIINSVPPPDVVFNNVKKLFVGAQLVMPVERTLAMIKPDAVKNGKANEIVQSLSEAGFVVVARKDHALTQEQANEFYAEHAEKPFFANLTAFMTSGPVVALLLEKPNAIKVRVCDSGARSEATKRCDCAAFLMPLSLVAGVEVVHRAYQHRKGQGRGSGMYPRPVRHGWHPKRRPRLRLLHQRSPRGRLLVPQRAAGVEDPGHDQAHHLRDEGRRGHFVPHVPRL